MNRQAISDSLIALEASRWMTRSFARRVEGEAIGTSLTTRPYGSEARCQRRAGRAGVLNYPIGTSGMGELLLGLNLRGKPGMLVAPGR